MNVLGALEARIPEVLGRHYDIAYPGLSMDTARGQRRSPIHAGTSVAGAKFLTRGGWERPEYFGAETVAGPLTFRAPAWRDQVGLEVEACRNGAAILDQSAFGKIMVQGPDATAFLNRVCAAEMDVATGRIVYSQILNARGGIESDITVQRHGAQSYLLIVGAGEVVRDMMRLRSVKPDFSVELTDVTSGYAILGLAGAQARAVLQKASRDAVPDIGRYRFATAEVGLARGWVGRLNYTGQEGYEIYVPADMAMAAHEALVAAGATHAGLTASGSLRIESGFRAWGHEMSPGITPFEAGTEAFLGWNSDFIGKDALSALRDVPVQRRIVSMLFDDPKAIPIHDEPIWRDGKVVGQITSAAWSYLFGRSVALAMVNAPLDALADGDIVAGFEVEIACMRYTAKASLKPAKTAFKG